MHDYPNCEIEVTRFRPKRRGRIRADIAAATDTADGVCPSEGGASDSGGASDGDGDGDGGDDEDGEPPNSTVAVFVTVEWSSGDRSWKEMLRDELIKLSAKSLCSVILLFAVLLLTWAL